MDLGRGGGGTISSRTAPAISAVAQLSQRNTPLTIIRPNVRPADDGPVAVSVQSGIICLYMKTIGQDGLLQKQTPLSNPSISATAFMTSSIENKLRNS